jgi:hypothetical protein
MKNCGVQPVRVAPRSHGCVRRSEPRLPRDTHKPPSYSQTRMNRPPPHVHDKEGVLGSSPSKSRFEPADRVKTLMPALFTPEVPTGVPMRCKRRDVSRNHAVRQRCYQIKNPCKSIGSWPQKEANQPANPQVSRAQVPTEIPTARTLERASEGCRSTTPSVLARGSMIRESLAAIPQKPQDEVQLRLA